MTSRSAEFSPVSAHHHRRHERAQLFALGPGGRVWLLHSLGYLGQRRGQPEGSELAEALVAGHGVQPWTEPSRITQSAHFGGGDDERVLDRVGRIGRIGE